MKTIAVSIQNLAYARLDPLRESHYTSPNLLSPSPLSSGKGLLLKGLPWLVTYLQIPACGSNSKFMTHTQVLFDLRSWNFIRPTCNCCGKCLHIYKLLLGKQSEVSLCLLRCSEQTPEISQQTKELGSDSLRAVLVSDWQHSFLLLILKPQLGHRSWAWKIIILLLIVLQVIQL